MSTKVRPQVTVELSSVQDVPEVGIVHRSAFHRDKDLLSKFFEPVELLDLAQKTDRFNAEWTRLWFPTSSSTQNTYDEIYFAKATIQEDGKQKIIGYAIWCKEPSNWAELTEAASKAKTEEEKKAEAWEHEGGDPVFGEYFWSVLPQTRSEFVGGQAHLHLRWLAVHADYQGLGAGKKLIAYGTDIAKELKYPAYVEASEAGLPVYQKCGFESVKSIVLTSTQVPGSYTAEAMVKKA